MTIANFPAPAIFSRINSMKYEVGKAYIHDGSAECPLPEGSSSSYLTVNDYAWDSVENIPWMRVLCFVPTFIPPQPIERWAVLDGDGDIVCMANNSCEAGEIAGNRYGFRIILMREVIE